MLFNISKCVFYLQSIAVCNYFIAINVTISSRDQVHGITHAYNHTKFYYIQITY